jgi:hypothetical protein
MIQIRAVLEFLDVKECALICSVSKKFKNIAIPRVWESVTFDNDMKFGDSVSLLLGKVFEMPQRPKWFHLEHAQTVHLKYCCSGHQLKSLDCAKRAMQVKTLKVDAWKREACEDSHELFRWLIVVLELCKGQD